MNTEIKSILNNLTVDNKLIPTAHIKYKGNSKTFVTWTVIGETPVLSAYDENLFSEITVDIDVFSEGNFLDIVNEIKIRFKNNEWIWIEDSTEMYEEDTKLYHITIAFKKERSL